MIPFFTQKLPDGRSYKVAWPYDTAQAMLKSIRGEVIEFFRARDIAQGLPVNGSCCEEKEDRSGKKVFTINQRFSAIKHSGRDVVDEVRRRWHEFCATDRDPLAVGVVTPFDVEMEAQQNAAKYAPIPVASAGDPPKRGRGRPRKHPRTE